MRISVSEGVVTLNVLLFAALLTTMTLLLPDFHVLDVEIETFEPCLPHMAIACGPVGNRLERRRLDAPRTPLRFAAAGDQPGALEHAQMLRHGRQTHVEGLGQLGDGALAGGEPR